MNDSVTSAGTAHATEPPRFSHDRYLIRRKVLTLFGASLHIYDTDDQVVAFCRMKAFKLKEDLRLYADESRELEVLRISARQVLDISATYDVIDPSDNSVVGSIRRKGMKSFFRDEWLLLDEDGREMGMVQEDSAVLATVRRFIEAASLVLPQKFHCTVHGQPVAHYKQNFNPFVMKIAADFSEDTDHLLDRRLGLALAILLCAIEGKQG